MFLPQPADAEARQDPITGHWVLIAPTRAHRPIHQPPDEAADDPKECPFCAGRESSTPPELFALRDHGGPDSPGWSVRVIPNRYPAVTRSSVGQDDSSLSVGSHELVIECPDHVESITHLSAAHSTKIWQTYARRLKELSRQPRLASALIFKNTGWRAGASQSHAHAQILATAIIPPLLQEELAGAKRYFRERGRNVFADLIEAETADGRRLLAETANFVAFCPSASRFPFEIWILPRKGPARFEHHPFEQLGELGELARSLLIRVESLGNRPAYNVFVHSAPFAADCDQFYHWHVEIAPRLVGLAGSEIGGGLFINPIPPEWAASRLNAGLSGEA